MEESKMDTNQEEWVTEDSLDTCCRIEELFLSLIHGVMTRIGKAPRSRVNQKTIAALRRIYKKHGRAFEPGANTPPLPTEALDALMWVNGKPPRLDKTTGAWMN